MNITIYVQCQFCPTVSHVSVPVEQYVRWKNGTFVQDAFPELTPSQREMLISGTCVSCWDSMFSER